MKKLLSGLVLATLLVACAKPLPAERLSYVGEWKGGSISLVILEGGRVIYARKEGNMSKSIDAPLNEFRGDNFLVGVGFMSTEFVVSKPPHEEGGLWKMTVDGIELTRMFGSAADVAVENPGSTST
jgi:hypothetical protein